MRLRHRIDALVFGPSVRLFFTENFTWARPSTTLIPWTLPTTTPAILTLSFGSSPVTSSNVAWYVLKSWASGSVRVTFPIVNARYTVNARHTTTNAPNLMAVRITTRPTWPGTATAA